MLDVSTLAPKLPMFFTQTAESVAQTIGFVERPPVELGCAYFRQNDPT